MRTYANDLVKDLLISMGKSIRKSIAESHLHEVVKESNVCGFKYRVDGPYVIRQNPDGSTNLVESSTEIQESLSNHQLKLLRKNRRGQLSTL